MTTAENDVMMFLLGYNLKMFVHWKKKRIRWRFKNLNILRMKRAF